MSTGFARLASRGSERGERVARRLARERRQLEAGRARTRRRRGSRARRRSSARRRGGPRGSGWRESRTAASASSSSESASDHARLRGRARRPPSSSRRARRCASPRRAAPALVRPPFIARIGFLRATRRASAPELARVPERLEVEQDELGLRVVLPVLEQVVRGDVRLVPDRDEGREPEPARGGLLEQREPERTALRREADVARAGSCAGAKVAFRPGAADEDAEAVRADQPRAVGAHEREQLLLAARALARRSRRSRPRSRRARASPSPSPPRPAASTASAGRQMTARSTGSGIVGDRGVGPDAGDRRCLRVDRVGDAAEVRVEDVAEELAADRAAARRGADDGDRPRREERRERGGDGDVVALVDRVPVGLGRSDLRGAPRSSPPLELARDGEAGVGEDAQHRPVRRHHLGDERRDARARRPSSASCSSSRVPTPWPCSASATANATSARGRVAQADVVRERDDPRRSPACRRARRGRPSRDRGTARRSRGRSAGSRGSAGRRSARRGPRRTRARRRRRRPTGGRRRSVPPWRRMTSRNSEAGRSHRRQCRASAPAGASVRWPAAAPYFAAARFVGVRGWRVERSAVRCSCQRSTRRQRK